ncbi:Rgp1-domain-containing protein [Phyllosticta citribraziliensis]|uniref:Rgp1-domain-containing protein n=1 Tax=Phyllosticta citribraziliensis TaxID=989973 RepID=A0ABR1MC53_9PEZI
MPSSTTPIRVSVSFDESCVFAGEHVTCTITFKNVSATSSDRSPARLSAADPRNPLLPGDPQRTRPKAQPAPRAPSVAHSAAQSVAPSVLSSVPAHASRNPPSFHHVSAQPSPGDSGTASPAAAGRGRGHRPALSLSAPQFASGAKLPSPLTAAFDGTSTSPAGQHGRSLSIMSLHSETSGATNGNGVVGLSQRPGKLHRRSASLQVVTGKEGAVTAPSGSGSRSLQPSPFSTSPSPPSLNRSQTDTSLPTRPGRRTSKQSTPSGTPSQSSSRKVSLGNFKFPPSPPSPRQSPRTGEMSPALEISPAEDVYKNASTGALNVQSAFGAPFSTSPDHTTMSRDKLQPSPVTRILSGSSMNGGSTRSSGEFYTISNNSTETLMSEYASKPSVRLLPKSASDRQVSKLGAPSQRHPPRPAKPEVLMMGYAQMIGSFVLDGSLVNQAPFEEVKRKGIMGGQGSGGVVGIEKKRDSGLFGALGWSNIGESLGGLLGGGEPSSIREMRALASSKAVPLLSTPQSILFVDLKLAPGESKSFKYTFMLPRGLPPTHKGRAIKVNYHLSIGTQRPGTAAQAVRTVNVPLRVFGSVTNRGEILGHDLMSPYVFLRDQATVLTVGDSKMGNDRRVSNGRKAVGETKEALEEFDAYVNNLLETAQQTARGGLLSPTAYPNQQGRRRSTIEDPPASSMKEAIDFAILRSNLSSANTSNKSPNRFSISRNGRNVAVIKLARPAYRLGETISLVIDFARNDVPVFAVAVALESSERVDPAIALRSTASIHRATRKIHASFAENTLYSRRVAFAPTVPPNASPEFVTSGVSLAWKLRFEFVTPRSSIVDNQDAGVEGQEGADVKTKDTGGDLMEEVAKDERGTILAAAERINVESFEVVVPIRVYGANTGSDGLGTGSGEDKESYAI